MTGPHARRPLRVAMLTQRYLPFTGGAELQLAAVLRHLSGGDLETTLITRRHDSSPRRELIEGVQVHRVPVPGPRAAASLFYSASALRILGSFRPDVVHAFELLSPSTTALAYKALTGVPVVAKVLRGGTLGDIAVLKSSRSGRLRLPRLMRQIDAFTVISKEIDRELALQGVDRNRRSLIPNGVDLTAFPPASIGEKAALRRRLGLPDGKIAIFLGRLEREKRADQLLTIWPKVRQSLPDATLLMLGSGSMEAQLRRMAPAGVRLEGVQRNVRDWYAAADVFVLPSVAEGLSNALLEAMAMGLPAVVTRVGAAPDLMDASTGRLVAVDDDDGLVAALIDVLSLNSFDPAGPRSVVEADFSLEVTAHRLKHLYRALAARYRGREFGSELLL